MVMQVGPRREATVDKVATQQGGGGGLSEGFHCSDYRHIFV